MTDSPLPQHRPIDETDLAGLISASAREDRFLEFKSEYLPQTDGGKREFLQSIAAFANSRGGDLVLGITQTNGVATALAPLQGIDPDQCRLQIRDLIRLHLRPPLGGVQVEAVPISAGGHVLVVRIPKSWAEPHLLTYNDDRRYYIRDDGGKRPMDNDEVRKSFLAGGSTGVRLRDFRLERCTAILKDETPAPLLRPQRVVLHLLPFEMFSKPRKFVARELFKLCQDVFPIDWSSCSRAFDRDGCCSSGPTPAGKCYGYAYVFRSGAIEAVDTQMLFDAQEPDSKVIRYDILEPGLVEAVRGYLRVLGKLDISPPYALFLSLLNVRGHCMPSAFPGHGGRAIPRDHLYLPEVVLEKVPDSTESALFPVFNSIWNACGFAQSANYDPNGKWNRS
jgi:hypothetical protein